MESTPQKSRVRSGDGERSFAVRRSVNFFFAGGTICYGLVSWGRAVIGWINRNKDASGVPVPWWLWAGVCVIVTALGAVGCYYLWIRSRRERAALRAIEDAAERRKELDAQKLTELKTVTPLATLLELNQGQIDEYHRIATDQADRSFRSSQRAMALGLVVLVGCFAAGLRFDGTQTKIFVASIAGLAAALSAFLNRTYLQMYGQTLHQLNRYFEQPVLTGYYLTAERLAQDLKDDPESEMRRRIIDQVLEASAQMNNTAESGRPRQWKRKAAVPPQAQGSRTPPQQEPGAPA